MALYLLYMYLKTSDYLTLLKFPIVTEKGMYLLVKNKYIFAVHPRANKISIRMLVEKIFNVRVKSVTTLKKTFKKKYTNRKYGFNTQYKKAIITLNTFDSIALFSNND